MENNNVMQKKFLNSAFLVFMFLLVGRIVSMMFIPLNDVTEARYAEIARKMLETGNWVTLFHDYGVPFWAKPPLSTWLSAGSMKLFGVSEFAARLPALLLSMAILWLIWDLVKKRSGAEVAALAMLVLSGTLYFFLNAGTVMTDPSLIFCTTLILVSFWHALVYKNKIWSYTFFIGIGLGLLAKGPIAIILAGMPIFFWVLYRNEWRNLWLRLPWIKGSVLMLIIAIPWYVLAEKKTPGFLNYFILGEHFHRFVTPGWAGDKYGFAHHQHWGMIWIFAVLGVIPWSLLSLVWLVQYRKNISSITRDKDGWMAYLFLCTTVSLLFFTFSSNIIYTYTFPCLPFFALFFTEFWMRAGVLLQARKLILMLSLLSGFIFFLATILFNVIPDTLAKTQKPVVALWLKQHPNSHSNLIYWQSKIEFSAQFYSAGKVIFINNEQSLCSQLSNHLEHYIVMTQNQWRDLAPKFRMHLIPVEQVIANGKLLLLLRSPEWSCD